MIFLPSAQIDSFASHGYVILDHALPEIELRLINQEFDNLLSAEVFKKAQVVAGPSQELIRSDWTFWLDEKSPPILKKLFLNLQALSPCLNENFYCGITEFQAHLALYPKGSGYQKHWDQATGDKRRKISLVLYLNSDWPKNYGGELVLYAPDSEKILEKIEPFGGRLVLFRSELFPHKVLPNLGPRRSLTGWFRSDAL